MGGDAGRSGLVRSAASLRRLLDGRWTIRRVATVAGVRARARAKGCRVAIDVDPTARLGRGVRFVVEAGRSSRVEIGPRCHIEDDVVVRLLGGSLRIGPDCSVRRGSVFHVGGELELAGHNMVSYYNVVHCAERVRFGEWAFTSEFVTVVDSRHDYDEGSRSTYENQTTAPVDIGRNVWLASKSSVLMGVTVGDDAVVAAHAVVTRDVPAKAVVGGIPAVILREA